MSKYIKRSWLSEEVERMIYLAKQRKERVGFNILNPYKKNEYWIKWVKKIEDSVFHYLDNAGVYIDIDPFDSRFTIGQLEVIQFVLDRRHKNGYQVF